MKSNKGSSCEYANLTPTEEPTRLAPNASGACARDFVAGKEARSKVDLRLRSRSRKRRKRSRSTRTNSSRASSHVIGTRCSTKNSKFLEELSMECEKYCIDPYEHISSKCKCARKTTQWRRAQRHFSRSLRFSKRSPSRACLSEKAHFELFPTEDNKKKAIYEDCECRTNNRIDTTPHGMMEFRPKELQKGSCACSNRRKKNRHPRKRGTRNESTATEGPGFADYERMTWRGRDRKHPNAWIPQFDRRIPCMSLTPPFRFEPFAPSFAPKLSSRSGPTSYFPRNSFDFDESEFSCRSGWPFSMPSGNIRCPCSRGEPFQPCDPSWSNTYDLCGAPRSQYYQDLCSDTYAIDTRKVSCRLCNGSESPNQANQGHITYVPIPKRKYYHDLLPEQNLGNNSYASRSLNQCYSFRLINGQELYNNSNISKTTNSPKFPIQHFTNRSSNSNELPSQPRDRISIIGTNSPKKSFSSALAYRSKLATKNYADISIISRGSFDTRSSTRPLNSSDRSESLNIPKNPSQKYTNSSLSHRIPDQPREIRLNKDSDSPYKPFKCESKNSSKIPSQHFTNSSLCHGTLDIMPREIRLNKDPDCLNKSLTSESKNSLKISSQLVSNRSYTLRLPDQHRKIRLNKDPDNSNNLLTSEIISSQKIPSEQYKNESLIRRLPNQHSEIILNKDPGSYNHSFTTESKNSLIIPSQNFTNTSFTRGLTGEPLEINLIKDSENPNNSLMSELITSQKIPDENYNTGSSSRVLPNQPCGIRLNKDPDSYINSFTTEAKNSLIFPSQHITKKTSSRGFPNQHREIDTPDKTFTSESIILRQHFRNRSIYYELPDQPFENIPINSPDLPNNNSYGSLSIKKSKLSGNNKTNTKVNKQVSYGQNDSVLIFNIPDSPNKSYTYATKYDLKLSSNNQELPKNSVKTTSLNDPELHARFKTSTSKYVLKLPSKKLTKRSLNEPELLSSHKLDALTGPELSNLPLSYSFPIIFGPYSRSKKAHAFKPLSSVLSQRTVSSSSIFTPEQPKTKLSNLDLSNPARSSWNSEHPSPLSQYIPPYLPKLLSKLPHSHSVPSCANLSRFLCRYPPPPLRCKSNAFHPNRKCECSSPYPEKSYTCQEKIKKILKTPISPSCDATRDNIPLTLKVPPFSPTIPTPPSPPHANSTFPPVNESPHYSSYPGYAPSRINRPPCSSYCQEPSNYINPIIRKHAPIPPFREPQLHSTFMSICKPSSSTCIPISPPHCPTSRADKTDYGYYHSLILQNKYLTSQKMIFENKSNELGSNVLYSKILLEDLKNGIMQIGNDMIFTFDQKSKLSTHQMKLDRSKSSVFDGQTQTDLNLKSELSLSPVDTGAPEVVITRLQENKPVFESNDTPTPNEQTNVSSRLNNTPSAFKFRECFYNKKLRNKLSLKSNSYSRLLKDKKNNERSFRFLNFYSNLDQIDECPKIVEFENNSSVDNSSSPEIYADENIDGNHNFPNKNVLSLKTVDELSDDIDCVMRDIMISTSSPFLSLGGQQAKEDYILEADISEKRKPLENK